MRRREFIALLGGATASWPLAARAQQQAMPVVGFLRSTSLVPFASLGVALRQGLAEVGFVEGRNIVIESRYAENDLSRLPAMAAELVRRPVNAIVANGLAANAVKAATTTIPIVFAAGDDPVNAGYVHLPNGTEAEWLKQLVAEQLVTVKTKRGFSRLEWQKLRERNEALDCRVYARAAAWIAGADRWTEAMWRNLEQQVRPTAPSDEEDAIERIEENTNIAGVLRRQPERRSRRVFRSSYMS